MAEPHALAPVSPRCLSWSRVWCEKRMQGFKSMNSAQHFLNLFSRISNHFRPRRHLLPVDEYRTTMQVRRFRSWSEITGLVCAQGPGKVPLELRSPATCSYPGRRDKALASAARPL